MRPMPMIPSRLPQMRCPSIHVGDQPGQCLCGSLSRTVPSASRLGTARIRARVISAVSSVRTPGVLVTMMPRTRAVSRSMLSTPVPKLAISFSCGPAWDKSERSILSVTVGTNTSAVLTAWPSSPWLMGLSPTLSRASKSSHMRVSTASGSLRVTLTIGLFAVGMATQALDGRADKPATRHPYLRGRRPAMELETCLTDAHLDDKTMLARPPRSRPSSPCQDRGRPDLISIRKLWLWQYMLGLFYRGSVRCRPRALTAALLVFAHALVGPTGLSAQGVPPPANGASGLPVPRFVSLKSDRVNLRQGPGTEYPTAWVFRRAGLPVEVIHEFEGWREVRDAEGTTGWVLGAMLSGRRTAVVLPWELKGGRVKADAKDGKGERPALAVLRNDDSER